MVKFFKFKKDRNTVHIVSLGCNPVPPEKYGGIELVIAHLCEGLEKIGCKVACYSPGELSIPGVRHCQTLPKPIAKIKAGGIPNSLAHLCSINHLLKKNIRCGDVVVFNHADHFRYLKWRLGVLRMFVNLCEIAHWMDAGLMRNIIYPSKHLMLMIGKPGVYIPHGEKLLFNCNINKKRDDYLFFAGRITKDKGVDIVLQAAKELNVPLFLAGPLNDTSFSDKILNDSQVVYLGELTYNELFEYYCKCKAVAYMTQYVEPFGLTVIEAMAAGAPVITTGLGGTGETVINGKTGFFAKNANEIMTAYKKLESLDEKYIVERAMDYTIDKMVLSYLSYFEKL